MVRVVGSRLACVRRASYGSKCSRTTYVWHGKIMANSHSSIYAVDLTSPLFVNILIYDSIDRCSLWQRGDSILYTGHKKYKVLGTVTIVWLLKVLSTFSGAAPLPTDVLNDDLCLSESGSDSD